MSDKIRELLNRIVPRLDAGEPNPIDPKQHHCEWVLYQERERIHAEFEEALAKQPAPAAPVAQEPERELVGYACDRRGALIQERCGDCLCWPAYENTAPPAAKQLGTVEVSCHTLARYADHLQTAGYNNAADDLRALLAGGEA